MNNRMSDVKEQICLSLALVVTIIRIFVKIFKVRLKFLEPN